MISYFKKNKEKTGNKNNIALLLIMAIAILARVIYISRFPAGLNCDEASAGYDAYCVLNTLHDRNGYLLPPYLMAWGTGQSALYMYMIIPFIKIFGLNTLSVRLPMAIVSSISIIVIYKIAKLICGFNCINSDSENERKISYFDMILLLLLFALNPWHIMKSRWGLDCNLFPDFVLFSVYYIIKYCIYKHKKYIYIAFVIFAISAYTYATSYVVLSIFCILLFIYLLKNKLINIKQILICISIVLIIDWPLILFVIINMFDLNEINLGFTSIPKLFYNRMLGQSVRADENVFISLFKNLKSAFRLFITQNDNIYWNRVNGFGIYYIFGFPLFAIGVCKYLINKFKKKNNDDSCSVLRFANDIFFIWLLAGIILGLLLANVNINRINYIWLPMIYFIWFELVQVICFIKVFVKKVLNKNTVDDVMSKIIYCIASVIIIISFLLFSYKYVKLNIDKENDILYIDENTSSYDCFTYGIKDVILYADSLPVKEINIYGAAVEAEIYVLFYTGQNYHTFLNTKEHRYNMDKSFRFVKSFGKWKFDQDIYLTGTNDVAYIFKKKMLSKLPKDKFDIKTFGNFIVCVEKQKEE